MGAAVTDDPIDAQAISAYCAAMTRELSALAEQARLPVLAYLLRLAEAEARSVRTPAEPGRQKSLAMRAPSKV